jgi:tetratricopeptide (TPR) repeat protein
VHTLCGVREFLRLGPPDPETELRLLGEVGNGLRGLGQHREAIPYLERAVRAAQRLGDSRREAANRVRLGTARQFAGDVDAAEADLRAAIGVHPDYDDFALQHLGKLLVERDRLREGLDCLRESLRLRQVKGDPELIASSQEAVTAAGALLGMIAPG